MHSADRFNDSLIKKKILLLGLFLPFCSYAEQPTGKLPVDWVDTQLGATHCRWFFYTPAALPFGMAKLAPTTNAYGSVGSWYPNGYDDRHTSIEGFAHLHEFQIGGIVTIPTVGPLKTVPGTQQNPDGGYRSRFSKSEESASPGYYRVTLADYGVRAELTATERVGYHRYTYPKADVARILFDIGHPQGESAKVVDTSVSYDPREHTVKGFVECYPKYAEVYGDKGNTVKSYFYARVPEKIVHHHGRRQFADRLLRAASHLPGKTLAALFRAPQGHSEGRHPETDHGLPAQPDMGHGRNASLDERQQTVTLFHQKQPKNADSRSVTRKIKRLPSENRRFSVFL